jgi:hypothetical protein
MVVVRLFGGMGNQMFQYAFGYEIANRLAKQLYIDLRVFEDSINAINITQRNFELECFYLSAEKWHFSMNHIFFPTNNFISKAYHQFKRISGFEAIIYEQKRGYNPEVFHMAKPNTYAIGYWQSYLYFEHIKERIRNEFRFKNVIDSSFRTKILQCKFPVAVHVRRGDYASNDLVKKKHGLLSLDYYRSAINYLYDKLCHELHFYIFSDDKQWCVQNFDFLNQKTIVETYNMPEWYDMYLMSICKFHIIANSTYSWWGAWLANYSDQIVIYPKFWMNGVLSESLNLSPKNWTPL